MARENFSFPEYLKDTAEKWRMGETETYQDWEKRKRREREESLTPEVAASAQAAREEQLRREEERRREFGVKEVQFEKTSPHELGEAKAIEKERVKQTKKETYGTMSTKEFRGRGHRKGAKPSKPREQKEAA